VRASVRLCPTACPTGPHSPMAKPNSSGIIIRVSGVRVPPPASSSTTRRTSLASQSHFWAREPPGRGGAPSKLQAPGAEARRHLAQAKRVGTRRPRLPFGA
jgi:hypothetical protein